MSRSHETSGSNFNTETDDPNKDLILQQCKKAIEELHYELERQNQINQQLIIEKEHQFQQIQRYESTFNSYLEEINSYKEELQNLGAEVLTLKQVNEGLEMELSSKSDIQAQYEEIKNELIKKNEAYQYLQKVNEDLEKRHAIMNEWSATFDEVNIRIKQTVQERDSLISENEILKNRLENVQRNLLESEKLNSLYEKQVENEQQDVKYKQFVHQLQLQNDQQKEQIKILEQKLETEYLNYNKQIFNSLQVQNDQLKEQIAILQKRVEEQEEQQISKHFVANLQIENQQLKEKNSILENKLEEENQNYKVLIRKYEQNMDLMKQNMQLDVEKTFDKIQEKVDLSSIEVDRLKESKFKLEEENAGLREQIRELKQEVRKSNIEASAIEQNMHHSVRQMQQETQFEQQQKNFEIDSLQQKLILVQNENKNLKLQQDKVFEQYNQQKDNIFDLQNAIQNKDLRIQELQNAIDQFDRNSSLYTKKIQNIQSQENDLLQQNEYLRSRLIEFQRELKNLQRDVFDQLEQEDQKTQDLERRILQSQKQMDNKNQDIEELRIEITQLRKNQGSALFEAQRLRIENDDLKKLLARYDSRFQEIENNMLKGNKQEIYKDQQIEDLRNQIRQERMNRTNEQNLILQLKDNLRSLQEQFDVNNQRYQEEIKRRDQEVQIIRNQYDQSVEKILHQKNTIDVEKLENEKYNSVKTIKFNGSNISNRHAFMAASPQRDYIVRDNTDHNYSEYNTARPCYSSSKAIQNFSLASTPLNTRGIMKQDRQINNSCNKRLHGSFINKFKNVVDRLENKLELIQKEIN
ncbi:hypothetical protein ABPG74_005280 [Tetrahymena malaccensis]